MPAAPAKSEPYSSAFAAASLFCFDSTFIRRMRLSQWVRRHEAQRAVTMAIRQSMRGRVIEYEARRNDVDRDGVKRECTVVRSDIALGRVRSTGR